MDVLDTFGVPEFYASEIGAMEDAGNGMMRIVHCVQRNGVLIPVVNLIRPACAILKTCPELRETAKRIMCQREAGARVH